MNDDYSYVGVPATTQEAMANEDHDPPIESSETNALAEPEAPVAPKLSALAVVSPFLLSISQNLTSHS